jgi:hypothetical protein
MLETSKDLLYVALAFCFVWLTVFLTWLLYYLIAIVRDVSRLTDEVRRVVERVDSLTRAIHDRFESGAASFSLFASAIKEIVGWAIRERSAKSERPHREKGEEAE